MKIIGKNSVSTGIYYFLLALFTLFSAVTVYQFFGFGVLYFNFKTGSNIMSDFFLLNEDVGWSKNIYTSTMNDLLKFKIFVPFTSQNLLTGVFEPNFIVTKIIAEIYLVMFTFYGAKFFREISTPKIFSINTVIWLKRFAWVNILFTVSLIVTSLIFKANHYLATILNGFSNFSYLFFGVLILFTVEFFKKGYELQSEQDLTV